MNVVSETSKDSIRHEKDEGKETPEVSTISPADSGAGATHDEERNTSGENATLDEPGVTLADITGAHVSAMGGFDPEIHALDASGNPRKKRDGSYALKRGRKQGVTNQASPQTAPNTSGKLPPKLQPVKPGAISGAVSEPADFRAIAGAAVGATLGIAVMTLGDDWRPRDKSEHSGLVDATAAYMEAQGVTDLPPGWLLLAVVAAYSMPRLTQPTTKSRIYSGWERVRGFFSRKRSVVAGEKTAAK